jgi:hypothetical protein
MRTVEYNRREVREKYRNLFKYSLDYIYVHDLRGNFLDANQVALNGLGYNKDEIEDLNFGDILVDEKDIKKGLKNAMEIKEKGRNIERSQYKIKSKDGSIIHLETYGIPLKKEGKTYAILGLGTNITERKLAKKRLKQSEERYRSLFQKSPFGIGIINTKGRVIDINPQLEELTGYTRDFFIGAHFLDLPIIQEKDIDMLRKRFKNLINGLNVHRTDLELKTKEGSFVWTHLQGSILKYKNEAHIQVILYDISERKTAELLINKQLRKLKELDQTRKDLMIRVSHELKTPLTVIQTGIEYLLESESLPLEGNDKEIITTVNRAYKRLRKLVENLIDATKIDYNKLKLSIKNEDLVNLVQDSISEFNYLIKKQNLTLKTQFPEKIIIPLDELRFRQVINNLLLNAIKNTAPKGEIILSLVKNKSYINFSVKDTGIGLTTKELKKLFTPFGKIERNEPELEGINIQGSGLGLYISKSIVELHGGKIKATSEGRNKGAEFTVRLPID